MSKVTSAAEAVADIADGASSGIACFSLSHHTLEEVAAGFTVSEVLSLTGMTVDVEKERSA